MANIDQHSEENAEDKSTSSHSEQEKEESDDKRRTVEENGQRLNWNNPEIHQQDKLPIGKEIPDDPDVRKFFDKDPNASTIHSSNADRTFGNEYIPDEQNETKDLSGDQSNNTSSSDDDSDIEYKSPKSQ